MTFEDYWSEVARLNALPTMAIVQLPTSLSYDTKRRMMRKRPEEAAEIIQETSDEINRGSVKSVDALLRSRL